MRLGAGVRTFGPREPFEETFGAVTVSLFRIHARERADHRRKRHNLGVLRPFTGGAALSPSVAVHGAIFTSWMLLLLVQTTLIAAGRTIVHRRLGVVGGLLAVAMMVVGWTTAIAAARRGYVPGALSGMADPLAGLVLPLRDLLMFVAFAAAGLFYRRNRDAHKRLLTLATINLLPAALGRMPMNPALIGPSILAFLIAGPIYDRVNHSRVHRIYLCGGLITVASIVAAFQIAPTPIWHRFAAWLIR